MVAPVTSYSSTPITLGDYDAVFVAAGGTIWVAGDAAIQNRFITAPGDPPHYSSVSATILGAVVAEFGQAVVFISSSFGGHTLMIGETGTLSGGITSAAVFIGGAGSVLHNSGQILGGGGVEANALFGAKLTNSGDIIGTHYFGIQLINSSSTEITNSGTIIGHAGIILANSTATIVNSGQIQSNTTALAAITATAGSAAFTLRNSGEISGPGRAIDGSAFADQVRNTGVIEGDVFLGAGHDVFKGKQGELVGTLSGDVGSDFLAGGDGDQLIYGGNDNDVLNGNAGDDTLFGGSGYDTFVFSRRGDDDTINGFQNGTDLIDMRAFHFANFAALSAKAIDAPGGMLIDLQAQNGGTVFIAGFTKALFGASDVIL